MQRMKSCNSEFHALTVNTVHLSADMDFAQHIFYIPPKIGEAIFFLIVHSLGSVNIYTTVVPFHSQTKKLSLFTHMAMYLCKFVGTKERV